MPEHAGVLDPPPCFMPFETPRRSGVVWNEQVGYKRPLCCRNSAKKDNNHAGVARRSGAHMHPISITLIPRESRATPWKVSGPMEKGKWQTRRRCALF